MSPKISVIIPSFNHAPYLDARIRSVLAQTFEDIEIILLDDCSTDDSRTILDTYRNHPKVAHCICNETNSGSTFRQWQRGLALAAGEYIWVAESDDLAAPQFLSRLFGVLETSPAVGLAYCQSAKIDPAGRIIGSWSDITDQINNNPWRQNFIADGRNMVRTFFILSNMVPNASAVLFRKKFLPSQVIEEACNYTLNGDWYVWCNILLRSDLAFVNEHLNFHRFHDVKGSLGNVANFNNISEFYRLRGFLYRELEIPKSIQKSLNESLFTTWMNQRRSMQVPKNSPDTLKVLAAAAEVDPLAAALLNTEPE